MKSKILPLLVVLLIACLLLAIFAGGAGERSGPTPEPGGPGGGSAAGETPDGEPPALAPLRLPLPAPGAPPVGESAEEGGLVDEAPPGSGLAWAARVQLGPVLREAADVIAYLDGVPAPDWQFVEASPETREYLMGQIATGTRQDRIEAVLALTMIELGPEDVSRLRGQFDLEFDSLDGQEAKNLVYALSFALHIHGDGHGVAALADAVRTGAHSEVKDFKNGAVLVLAIVNDVESAPLLRDLLSEDPDRAVRKHAAVGLGRFGGDENWMALAEALVREEDVEVRAWSALAAGRAASEGTDDTPLRQALAVDTAGEVRGAAAFALGLTGGEGTEAALESAFFADDHPFTRIGAVAGIATRDEDGNRAEFLTGQGAPYLDDLVRTSGDSVARFYAVTALAMLPPSEARAAGLRHAAANDTSLWVKLGAIDRLVEAEGEAAGPFLEERFAAEEEGRVRAHLEAALSRLSSD